MWDSMQNRTNRYLAFDQALANTGYAIYDAGTGLYQYGVITSKPEELLVKRYSELDERFKQLINAVNPICIFTEKVYTPRQMPTAWPELIKVELLIHLIAYNKAIQTHVLASSTREKQSWRFLLGIDADKNATKKRYGIKNQHSADAIAILQAGLYLYQGIPLADLQAKEDGQDARLQTHKLQ